MEKMDLPRESLMSWLLWSRAEVECGIGGMGFTSSPLPHERMLCYLERGKVRARKKGGDSTCISLKSSFRPFLGLF